MPGCLSSAVFGPLMWMLATSTAWINQHSPKRRHKEKRRGPNRAREEEKRNEIKLTSVYVDDQDNALRFYTEVLGFAKKTDFSQGSYRWLTVASPEEPEGTELQVALNNNPAAKAYQQALFQQSQPAIMFFTDDIKGDQQRINSIVTSPLREPTLPSARRPPSPLDFCLS